MFLQNPCSWSVNHRGVTLEIDPGIPTPILKPIVCIDIETDEKNNFVGGAVYDGGKSIYYFTNPTAFTGAINGSKIIGYNVKSDLNWLAKMGLKVNSQDIYADPMLMAYVVNSNRPDQSLKAVAADLLGWHWPSYRDMVGKGAKKITLDKQDVDKVAEYCAMDTLATWKLYELFNKTFNQSQRDLYNNVELPTYRILWDMECKGIRINTSKLDTLDLEFGKEVLLAETALRAYYITWNPNSPPQTLKVLASLNIHTEDTAKPTLIRWKMDNPKHPNVSIIDQLLAYKKIKKLHSTYVLALKERTKLTDIINTTFNQVAIQDDGSMKGIRTGRLSSNNPNLQNIPATRKGETYGQSLRSLFVPREKKVFIDVDYSQIEYRLLAHFSQDRNLVDGFNKGMDAHDVTGRLLGCDRKVGKTLNFASIYGAQSEKIAVTAGVTVSQAEQFLSDYWIKLPQVKQWINTTLVLARSRGGVTTMSGRFIPLPDLASKNKWKCRHAERAAINYVIQGSAADIIKVAMIQLDKQGYKPVLQVHDELIFEVDPNTAQADMQAIVKTMENVVKLSVPIVADAKIGSDWNEAKGD